MTDLDRLAELAAAATPGPWRRVPHHGTSTLEKFTAAALHREDGA